MDQDQPQPPRNGSPARGGAPPPSAAPSPARPATENNATAAMPTKAPAMAAAADVTRSTSIGSQDSHAPSLCGSGSGSGGGGSLIGGAIAQEGCGGDASSTTLGGSRSGSFRSGSSPLSTPRQPAAGAAGGGSGAGASSVPPFPNPPLASTPPPGPPPAGVAPPPWPTPEKQQRPPPQPVQQPPPAAMSSSPNRSPSSRHANVPPAFEGGTPTKIHFPANPNPPAVVVGAFPHPSLSLSMTNSGDALCAPSHNNAGANNNAAATGANNHATDDSVRLGLEELERQQAGVEKRREEAAARALEEQRRQLQLTTTAAGAGGSAPPSSGGLPPLPPAAARDRPASAPPKGCPEGGRPPAVPSQIHLSDEDEETVLSAPGGGDKQLKRVTSIEKMRESVSVSLRRLRSWSQDALNRSSMDPAAGGGTSVDSTQNTLSRGSNEGAGEGGRPGLDTIAGPAQQRQASHKSSGGKKVARSDVISEPFLDEDELKPLIYGYLHKLGRNGHWQKRFFETNGERLTYYKSVKRTKVLATLDLCKVGEIAIEKTDPEGCTFTIAVKNRPYFLRAEDKARCADWVIILNRAREARMNVGNIQLINPKAEGGADGGVGLLSHRSQAGSDDYAPCIVISALRPRTKAVMNFEGDDALAGGIPDLLTSNTTEEQIEVMKWDDHHVDKENQQHPQGVVGIVGGGGLPSPLPVRAGEVQAMAKWQKRHSRLHMLSLRFLRWARSITHQADACKREMDVVVVPAHVVAAATQQAALAAVQGGGRRSSSPSAAAGGAAVGPAAAPGAGAGHRPDQQMQQLEGTKHKLSPTSGGMPDLLEETPPPQPAPTTPVEADDNPDSSVNTNRSRASTESPAAFGSAYV